MKKLLLVAAIALPVTALASVIDTGEVIKAAADGSLADYLSPILITAIKNSPQAAMVVGGISALMPFISLVANRTANPIDNAVMILLNKLLQTLAFNSAHNQPDVLSWPQMLTNKPSSWADLLRDKLSVKASEQVTRVGLK